MGVAAELGVFGIGFAIVGLSPGDTEQNMVLISGLVASVVVMIVAMDREVRRRDRSASRAAASDPHGIADPDK